MQLSLKGRGLPNAASPLKKLVQCFGSGNGTNRVAVIVLPWCATGNSSSSWSCLASWNPKGREHDHVGAPSVSLEENIPWIGYVWPCSAHQKCFIMAPVLPLPCARRWPCWSTWRSKAACIPVANWPPCCGLTVSPMLPAQPCATPSPCCAACSPTPPPLLLRPPTCSVTRSPPP